MSAQPLHPVTWPDGYYLAPRNGWPRRIVLLCGDCAEGENEFSPHDFIDGPDVEGQNDCGICGRVLEQVTS